MAYFTALSPQELLASNAVAVVRKETYNDSACDPHHHLTKLLPHLLVLFLLICLSDFWGEIAGGDVLGHAHLCGPLHLWGGQRLPLHVLTVGVTA